MDKLQALRTGAGVIALSVLGILLLRGTDHTLPAQTGGECMGAFEQAWPAPDFRCTKGQPNQQCLDDAKIAYEQYMQMATFTKCEALNTAQQKLDDAMYKCQEDFYKCVAAAEGGSTTHCVDLLVACKDQARSEYGAAMKAASGQFYQDMLDAINQFYTSAMECCPQ